MTTAAPPRVACACCQRADQPTTPTETKRHGVIRLCAECVAYCKRRGWLAG